MQVDFYRANEQNAPTVEHYLFTKHFRDMKQKLIETRKELINSLTKRYGSEIEQEPNPKKFYEHRCTVDYHQAIAISIIDQLLSDVDIIIDNNHEKVFEKIEQKVLSKRL